MEWVEEISLNFKQIVTNSMPKANSPWYSNYLSSAPQGTKINDLLCNIVQNRTVPGLSGINWRKSVKNLNLRLYINEMQIYRV